MRGQNKQAFGGEQMNERVAHFKVDSREQQLKARLLTVLGLP